MRMNMNMNVMNMNMNMNLKNMNINTKKNTMLKKKLVAVNQFCSFKQIATC
jgi:hypothetical protein